MSMASFISFPGDAETLSKVGDGLRTIISGFGMLVGICWDKAFETAHETVAETVPLFHSHPVIGTGLVAAVLIVFVVPAWYWYIVPNAMKAEEAHKEDILRENKRARESPTLTGLSSDEQESLTVDSDEKSLT
ncbi:unnamed protein product [Effrenium voratum]|nr:unnamed protein product [Effrenium voratum]CAJ1418215.1 unnamed protein product [Effrenium voratum]